MKSRQTKTHPFNLADTAVILVFLLLGVFFFYFSFIIDDSLSGNSVGPRLVPQIISILLILLTVALLIKSMLAHIFSKAIVEENQIKLGVISSSTDEFKQDSTAEIANPTAEQQRSKTSWAVRLLPLQILILSMAYVAMFQWFGYLAATIICAVPIYASFGNRTLFSLFVVPTITIVLLYSFFFGGIGLYDLPGSVIDITEWFR